MAKSNDSRITNEQVKSLKLGDYVVKSVTLPATIVESVGKGNEGIVIGGTAANPTVGVQVSTETGNGLQIKDSGNKGLYVSAKTLGLSTAYIPKGSMKVGESATNLKNGEVGWVYNMSDSGQVANGVEGTITVKTGDNLVILNTGTEAEPVKKWDKLSATIDVPVYTGSGAIKVTGTVISLDNGKGLNQNNNTLGLTLADKSLSVVDLGLKANLKTNGGLALETTPGEGIKVNVDGGGLVIPTDGTNAGKVRVNPGDGLIIPTTGTNVGKVQVNVGDGLVIPTTGTNAGKVQVNPADGLIIPTTGANVGKVQVNAGLGLEFSGDPVPKVQVKAGDGLVIPTAGADAGEVQVNAGDGLVIPTTGTNAGKVQVNPADGLIIPTDGTNAGKVQVRAADDSISVNSSGVSVKKAGGLTVDNGLKVDVDGATIKLDNSKVALKAAPAGGLDTTDGTNGVSVKTGGGLQKNASNGTISVKANASKAIEVDASDGVGVVAGNNIAVSSSGVVVDIDKSTGISDDTTIEGVITLLGGTINPAS
jgi:hypothetical protein